MEGEINGFKYEVLMEKDNKVIGRKEVIVKLEAINKSTPKREEAREIIAKLFKWNKDLVIVRRIRSYFGLPRFFIEAHLYENEDRLKYFEPLYILKRNNLIKEEAQQAQS